jgi:hypothetical protein
VLSWLPARRVKRLRPRVVASRSRRPHQLTRVVSSSATTSSTAVLVDHGRLPRAARRRAVRRAARAPSGRKRRHPGAAGRSACTSASACRSSTTGLVGASRATRARGRAAPSSRLGRAMRERVPHGATVAWQTPCRTPRGLSRVQTCYPPNPLTCLAHLDRSNPAVVTQVCGWYHGVGRLHPHPAPPADRRVSQKGKARR